MPIKEMPHYRILSMLRTSDEILIPWNYREMVQGWIYKHLGSFGEQIHDAPFSLFTFSLSAPTYQISKKGIIADTWLLRLASAHQEILDTIEKELTHGVKLDGKRLDAVFITKELFTDKPALSSSPIITFAKQTKKYQNPLLQKEDFYAAVAASLANRWEYFTGSSSPEIVFSFKGRPQPRKIQYKNRFLIGYEGDIRLISNPEIIQFAQCVGLGAKASCGLGMVV